jgi:predicted house-cleaning NTP pyrophosphatase (Maf/HAM1 superfamily)
MKLLHKLEELKAKGDKVDIIITADTIISLDGKEIVEKARDKEHAY